MSAGPKIKNENKNKNKSKTDSRFLPVYQHALMGKKKKDILFKERYTKKDDMKNNLLKIQMTLVASNLKFQKAHFLSHYSMVDLFC